MSSSSIRFAWQEHDDGDNIILYTRCRIARNLREIPFHHRYCTSAQKKKLSDSLSPFFEKKNFKKIIISKLSQGEIQYFLENKVITREISQNPAGICFFRPQLGLSVLIGEEDHLRIACFAGGFQLSHAVEKAYTIEQDLQNNYSFAYREPFGFLTSCPTNTGTAMRLSVLVHLRALYMMEKQSDVLEGIKKMGLEIRGIGGRGYAPDGPIIQLSNRISLGISEWDLMEKFQSTIQSLIDREKEARKLIYKQDRLKMKDTVMRSAAILSNSYLMDFDEALSHLSLYYLGISIGIIKFQPVHGLGYYMSKLSPSNLAGLQKNPAKTGKIKGENTNKKAEEQQKELLDQKRATILRKSVDFF